MRVVYHHDPMYPNVYGSSFEIDFRQHSSFGIHAIYQMYSALKSDESCTNIDYKCISVVPHRERLLILRCMPMDTSLSTNVRARYGSTTAVETAVEQRPSQTLHLESDTINVTI